MTRPRRVGLARLVASGFGSGLVPVAAGTAGSLAALLAGALLMRISAYALPLAALAATFGGLWAVQAAGAAADDPGWVVIDEFAGVWITMLGLARPSPSGLLAAFLLFRLLDITKLGPIGWADRRKDAVGVMGDDVIAGGIAGAIVWGVGLLWPWVLA